MRKTLVIMATLALSVAPQQLQARHHRRAPLPPARPADLDPSAEGAPAEMAAPEQPQSSEAPRIFVDAPMPPERPEEFSVRPADPSEPPLAYAAPIEPERQPAPFVAPALAGAACLSKLKEAGVEFEEAAQPHATLDGCHIPTPVHVGSVPVSGRRVSLPAKPLLDCAYVLHFSDFIARLAAPLGPQTVRSALVALDTGPGYECRGRNRVHGARISAHGKGIALDVSGFIFEDGRKVAVEAQREAATHAYFNGFRKGACGWFTTVLGPGSDGYHESHLHLDTESHGRHGMHYCH